MPRGGVRVFGEALAGVNRHARMLQAGSRHARTSNHFARKLDHTLCLLVRLFLSKMKADAMSEADDFRQAKAFSEKALAAMIAQGVPPTPENFTVWYSYATGLVPELKRAIDLMIANQGEFNQTVNSELYSRFCDSGEHFNLMQETGDRLHHAADQIIQYVKTASGDTRAFGKTLDQYSTELGAAPGGDKLRTMMSGLILETQRVADRNRTLEAQLSDSSTEIQQLRQNLELVRREALTDALTGIPNRKFFDTRLRAAVLEANNTGEPLSLLITDIDHFKHFNDTYGHQMGDQVLRLVARTLTDSVKGRDTPARYGGEEFAIILPQTRLQDALVLAEQIRRTIMRRHIVRRDTGDDFGTITLSMGVATYHPTEHLVDTLRRADAALYQAKRSGRNRVISEEALEKQAAE
jgi:diguanylate cyclase